MTKSPLDQQRLWLREVIERSGKSASKLAAELKIGPSTLTRALNERDYPHELSRRTIRKIEAHTGIAFTGGGHAPGLEDAEAAPYQATGSEVDALVETFTGRANGRDPWVLRSRALEAAGYLPDDILIVDLNQRPQAGEIVCAQVYDWASGKAETIFRIYQKPHLIAATGDRKLQKVHVVDDERVVIKGRVIASIRDALANAA